jgi:acetoin utilization deacetylase AcuC-like enzyme
LAGVDILASDKLEIRHDDGCKRDELVFELCSKYQIPLQVSMGGGYSDIKTIIEATLIPIEQLKYFLKNARTAQ